jgi:hypothetical protein
MPVTIARTIGIPEWNSEIQQEASAFWTKHGMTMSQDENSLSGHRGGLFAVLSSAKPSAMPARLTITSLEITKIDCVLKVSTALQIWCIWDKTAFELELSLFGHFLKTGNSKDEQWQSFVEAYQKHYWMANLTGGLMGLTMSEKERRQFRADIEITDDR